MTRFEKAVENTRNELKKSPRLKAKVIWKMEYRRSRMFEINPFLFGMFNPPNLNHLACT